jgi:hypothetical protein
MARSSPCGVKNKATKVWAAEAFAYLGRIWPKRYELSSCDGRSRATLGTSKLGRVTLAHFSSSPHLYLHPSEWASEVADTLAGRRSDVVARLLIGGRRSPKGERVVVEQLRCNALSRESEPINPRVCTGERRCSGSLLGLRQGQIRWWRA